MLFVNCADVGFSVPNHFVVGYSLDYNEYFRDLNVCVCHLWVVFIIHRSGMVYPSVLRHCWLGDRKGIRPVK